MNNNKLKQVIQQEYKKCVVDPIYFMKKYCTIQHPKDGKIKFNLYDYQEKLYRAIYSWPNLSRPV